MGGDGGLEWHSGTDLDMMILDSIFFAFGEFDSGVIDCQLALLTWNYLCRESWALFNCSCLGGQIPTSETRTCIQGLVESNRLVSVLRTNTLNPRCWVGGIHCGY